MIWPRAEILSLPEEMENLADFYTMQSETDLSYEIQPAERTIIQPPIKEQEEASKDEIPAEYSIMNYLIMYVVLFISMGVFMIVGFWSLQLFN
jgi:hypothetical protein